MKKINKPLIFPFLFLVFTFLFNVNTFGQWPTTAPVTSPTGGFRITGTVKATTAVGDWCDDAIGTGGFVLQLGIAPPVWGPINSSTTIFQRDAYNDNNDLAFSGSSFSDDPNTWKWASAKPTSKCDIATAMFHITASNDSKWIILGGDRYSTTGTSYIDVEFNQGILTRRTDSTKFRYVNADGSPIVGTGGRIPNDFVLSMEYSNGGATAVVHYYVWENSGGTWKYVEHSIPTIVFPLTPTGAVSAYGATNADSTDVPYGAFGRTKYEPFAFVEAAVNIDAILGTSCSGTGLNIRTVMVKTKASDAYNAALKDFVEPQPVSFHFGSESMNYGDGTFCKSEGTASPTKSGSGTFTSTPPGLVFTDGSPSTSGVINVSSSTAGTYTVTYTFSAGGGCTGTQTATVTINDATPGTISGDQTICSGGDPVVFGSVAGTGLATVTYKWQSSTGTCGAGTFADITGATSATYDVPSGLTTTTTYRRIATSTVNGESCTAISNCVTVTVNAVTAGTVAGNQTICSGGNPAAFTVSVAATGSQGPTYQWQKSTTDCSSGFADIPLATSSTYDDPGPVTQTTYYRRIATSTVNSIPCTATSNCITVTVNNVTAGTVAGDQTICSGGNPAAFTVSVAATGSATPTYQWQKSTTDCSSGFADIVSATSATYDDPGPVTSTTYYRRIAISTLNSIPCTATSNCITVTVNNVTAGTVAGSQAICSGGNPAAFTVSVAATGSQGPTYQWQKSTTDCTTGFTDIPSATLATYDDPGPLTQTTYYRRIATSTVGGVACSATSNCLTVTVNPNPTVTVNSPVKCSNDAAVNITATPTPAEGGGVSYTYAWTTRPPGVADPGNLASFSATVAGTYGVTITRVGSGCTASNTGSLTVNDNPATPSVCVIQPSLCGPAFGKVSFTDLGAGYTYSIKNGVAGQWHTCPVFTNVAAGDVTGLKVKSPAGCVSAAATCNTICQTDPVACGSDVQSRTAPQQMTNIEESQFKVKAYPNPFSDKVKFVVTSPVDGNGILELYNMMGQKIKVIYSGHFNAGNQNFELSLPAKQVATLVYVLRVGGKQVTGKLVQVN